MNDITRSECGYDVLEKVIIEGDLAKLTPKERLQYYNQTCQSLNLNPLTQPFKYIKLNNKLTLYASKDCTDQLRKNNEISIYKLERELDVDGQVFMVTVHARDKFGREDVALGAVNIAGLKGEALANARMKCETKGKRRVTLSLCGLGWTDESEVDSIPDAERINVNMQTGEVIEDKKTEISVEGDPTLKELHNSLNKIYACKTESELKNTFYPIYQMFYRTKHLDAIVKAKDVMKVKLSTPQYYPELIEDDVPSLLIDTDVVNSGDAS